MATFQYTQTLRTPLLLIALCAASSSVWADPGAAATAVATKPTPAAAAAGVETAVLQPPTHLGIDKVAGSERAADCPVCPECPQASGLESFSSRLNGTYQAGGKADSAIPIAFPQAPQAGSTLATWLNALNDQLLVALNLKLSATERAQYWALERQKCQTVYCQIAMRQQTAYYLLGGK